MLDSNRRDGRADREDREEYYRQGNGNGANVYIGTELIKVIDRFKEVGDYNTRSEASNELARLIKQTNLLLRDPDDLGEWGGKFVSMSRENDRRR